MADFDPAALVKEYAYLTTGGRLLLLIEEGHALDPKIGEPYASRYVQALTALAARAYRQGCEDGKHDAATRPARRAEGDVMANEMPAEIDFRGGQRGKHYPAYIQPGQTTGNTTVPAALLAALDALTARAVEAEHDALAYRGALGYSMPGSHNGRLTDGTLPNNGIAQALETRLAEVERERDHWHESFITEATQRVRHFEPTVAALVAALEEHRQIVVGLLSLEGAARDADVDAFDVLPKLVEALKNVVPKIDAVLRDAPRGTPE